VKRCKPGKVLRRFYPLIGPDSVEANYAGQVCRLRNEPRPPRARNSRSDNQPITTLSSEAGIRRDNARAPVLAACGHASPAVSSSILCHASRFAVLYLVEPRATPVFRVWCLVDPPKDGRDLTDGFQRTGNCSEYPLLRHRLP
jgi:hypothetical protein